MQLVDARRLMGPNLLARSPLVLVELALEGANRERARSLYLSELARIRTALGYPAEVHWLERPHDGGTVIAYSEPIDVLLACTEMSEWAALSAIELHSSREPLPLEPKRAEVEAMLERDRSPRLLALEAEAARRELPLLWDDEMVTLGMGSRSASWRRSEVPEVATVDWELLGRIPIALVTGTNGKSTSTRLIARIARAAGKRVGSTSSDAIMIGGDLIEEGDWTGPAAARVVLQRQDVDVAVLETARGGILRRGLAVDACDVAVITNVTDDHLGEYGIHDLDALAQAKAVTVRAARTAVLNAQDPRLVALANELARVVFFADGEGDEVIEQHRRSGGEVVFTSGDRIVHARGAEPPTEIATISAIPITFGGAARFNVENALAAVGAALALGLPPDAITRGLEAFTPAENPRRSVMLERNGARLVLDFGHNAAGIRASMKLVTSLRGNSSGKLIAIIGSAGDRSNRELGEMARALSEARPDVVIMREIVGYLRGRALGDAPEVFRRAFLSLGMQPSNLLTADSEVSALRQALSIAEPGDFIVLLVHLEEDEVRAFLGHPGVLPPGERR